MKKSQAIDCALLRGGTSKGVFIEAGLLPQDRDRRNEMLLHLLGDDATQLDGLGGGNVLSSKVALVEASGEKGVDVDYSFVQVMPARGVDDTVPCGNILSGVAPFAIETGIVQAGDPETTVHIRDKNTGTTVHAKVQTPGGKLTYDGDEVIAGTQKPGAPISLEYTNISGRRTGSLWPTAAKSDTVDGVQVTLVDAAIPVAILPAKSVGLPDNSKIRTLNMRDLIDRLLGYREAVAKKGGIDTKGTSVPKVCLVNEPATKDADISVRYFTPYTPHTSLAVTGAITIATAGMLEGTVAHGHARKKSPPVAGEWIGYRIEHISGILPLEIKFQEDDKGELYPEKARLVRTARMLMRGKAYIPKY